MATDHSMTAEEFREALQRLGFARDASANDLGLSAFARFVGKEPRTVRYWAERGPDSAAVTILRLMLAAEINFARAEELMSSRGARGAKRRR